MEISKIAKDIFVSCPFDQLIQRYLKKVIQEGINLEIGLNGTVLDDYLLYDFYKVSRQLLAEGIECTVHAPFTDVSIGAIDKKIREVSVDRLKRALDICVIFNASQMVFHSGWERKIYAGESQRWLENVVESINGLLTYAKGSGVKIMLENVFELDPLFHNEIFKKIEDMSLGFCLDAGHVYAFSNTELDIWLETLGERIGHLHLHDNHGSDDEHLAPGQGIIDFDMVFSWLSKRNIRPIFTLEAHNEDTVIPGLKAVSSLIKKYYNK